MVKFSRWDVKLGVGVFRKDLRHVLLRAVDGETANKNLCSVIFAKEAPLQSFHLIACALSVFLRFTS